MMHLTADEIADLLNEPAVDLLRNLVRTLGSERTEAFVEEVLQIEASGGMPRPDGQGRRTPGGALLTLVKDRVTGRQRHAIFQSGVYTPPARPCRWGDVNQALETLHTQPVGDATVKVTLIGRPLATQIQGQAVVFELKGTPPPTLPKGLPPVPAKTPITWTVLVASKQWNKVKASLEADQQDKLVIEGYPFTENGLHVLMAMSCRSIAMQRAEKAGQKTLAAT